MNNLCDELFSPHYEKMDVMKNKFSKYFSIYSSFCNMRHFYVHFGMMTTLLKFFSPVRCCECNCSAGNGFSTSKIFLCVTKICVIFSVQIDMKQCRRCWFMAIFSLKSMVHWLIYELNCTKRLHVKVDVFLILWTFNRQDGHFTRLWIRSYGVVVMHFVLPIVVMHLLVDR